MRVSPILGRSKLSSVSIPFEHPKCPAKQGAEKTRVRGKYVSAERVRELDNGMKVEWKMATSSDAGGNIPRFMTNSSLPNSISEDVPSFLKWMVGQLYTVLGLADRSGVALPRRRRGGLASGASMIHSLT